jgi:hypothetical protein
VRTEACFRATIAKLELVALSSLFAWRFAPLWLALGLCACHGDDTPQPSAGPAWTVAGENLDSALISVWGSAADDVWAVGADTGSGPLVLHYDGSAFERLDTGTTGDLWWVFGFAGGPVFFGGAGGAILRYADGAFQPLATPDSSVTVFGLWGSAPDDMWAVGGTEGGAGGAFAWRLAGDSWAEAPGFPPDLAASSALWKVWGSAADDAWLVGTAGSALHFDGGSFETESLGGGESLFTVHYAEGRFVAVGGSASGIVFENNGSGWQRVDDGSLSALVGVHMTSNEMGYAVGRFGEFAERRSGKWLEAVGPDTSETLHAVWADPTGGLWVVGGALDVRPRIHGIIAYRGRRAPARVAP